MAERKKVLFAGNGINIKEGEKLTSWNEIIKEIYEDFCGNEKDIYEEFFVKYMESMNQYEPLFFYSASKTKNFNERDFKNKLAQKTNDRTTNELKPNDFHRKALTLYDEIITTNYDLCFEEAAKEIVVSKGKPSAKPQLPGTRETIYSLRRKTNLCKHKKYKEYMETNYDNFCTYVWHPHGAITEGKSCKSICQTRDMYTGNLTKLKDYLMNQYKLLVKLPKNKPYEFDDKSSWAHHFLFSDIDMIGQSMSLNEIDIWWLLSYRAYLKREGKIKIDNTIKYIAKNPEKDNKRKNDSEEKNKEEKNKDKGKFWLLKSLFVDVYFVKDAQDYDFDFIMKTLDKENLIQMENDL